MELNEHQFGSPKPTKWLTDQQFLDRFTEERDEKQDYTPEDDEAYKQHMRQWIQVLHVAEQRRPHFKKDPTAVDKAMDTLKEYNPTREQVADVLKFGRNKNFGEIHRRLDMHLGS
jgi:hypothetical protein